jgi:hypothetical protein
MQGSPTLVVKKKKKDYNDNEGSSSMFVGETHGKGQDRNGSKEAEEELYRLMRGAEYDTEEEEDEGNSTDGEDEVLDAEHEPVVSPVELEESTDGGEEVSGAKTEPVVPPVEPKLSAPEWGSSSAVPEWGSGTHSSTSTGAGWIPTYAPSELMSWNSGVRNTNDQEVANRWLARKCKAKRKNK